MNKTVTAGPQTHGRQLVGLLGSGLVEAVGFGLALAILAPAKPSALASIRRHTDRMAG